MTESSFQLIGVALVEFYSPLIALKKLPPAPPGKHIGGGRRIAGGRFLMRFFDVFSRLFLTALWVPIRVFLASFFACVSLLFRCCFRAVKKGAPAEVFGAFGGVAPSRECTFHTRIIRVS